jgi:hypothetical protein
MDYPITANLTVPSNYSTDSLLYQAEQALIKQDFTAMLPYAAELGARASSPDVYAFFKKLTRQVLCAPGEHIQLFSHCLDAVCSHDTAEGAAFLENMLALSKGVEGAASAAAAGILH